MEISFAGLMLGFMVIAIMKGITAQREEKSLLHSHQHTDGKRYNHSHEYESLEGHYHLGHPHQDFHPLYLDQTQRQDLPAHHYHGYHAHSHPTKYLLHMHHTVGGDLSTAGPEIPVTPHNN